MDLLIRKLRPSGFLKLSAFLTTVLYVCSSAWALSGGRVVGKQEFPTSLRLQFSRDQKQKLVCTGVRISSRHILTAAHCFGDLSWSGWACGEDLGAMVQVKNNQTSPRYFRLHGIYIHPDVTSTGYRFSTMPFENKFDLAVVEFEQDLPVDFPEAVLNYGSAPVGLPVFMGGFGQTSVEGMAYTPTLKMAAAKLVSFQDKKFELKNAEEDFIFHGDSGGPVYALKNRSVIGINSSIEPGRRETRQVGMRDVTVITGYRSFATPLRGQRSWITSVLQRRAQLDCRP